MKNSTIRELKARARVLLEGQYRFLALVTFILMLAQYLLDAVINYAFPLYSTTTSSILYFACSLLSNILFVILLAGAYKIYLNLMRGLSNDHYDLFFAFTNQPEQVAIYALVRFVIAFAFSETLKWFMEELFSSNPRFPFFVDLAILLIITVITLVLQLGYSLSLYLYCDRPWDKMPDLLKESIHLMRGNYGRLIRLNLSFLGLSLLGVLSFGIGLLFIEPYLNMTLALFYEDLTGGRFQTQQEYSSGPAASDYGR